MVKSQVKIKVVGSKNTGFLPEMGQFNATKVQDGKGVAMYELSDERAGSYNGAKLNANQVTEVA